MHNVYSLHKMRLFNNAHVAIVPQDNQSDIEAVKWIFNTSFTQHISKAWIFSSRGMLALAENHECSHVEV